MKISSDTIKALAGLLLCFGLLANSQQLNAEVSAQATFEHAEQYVAAGDVDAAILEYREILSGSDQETGTIIRASTELASLLVERAQHQQGARDRLHAEVGPLITHALQLARSASMYRESVRLLTLQWLLALQQNQHGEMAALLLDALGQLELAQADESERMDIYRDLSYTYILTGQFARAKYFLRRTIVDGFRSGNSLKLTEDFLSIADAYLKTGELDVASRYYTQVLAMNPGSDSHSRQQALFKLGTIERELGRPAQALEKHQTAYQYFSKKGLYRELVAEIQLARDFLQLGDLKNAKYFAQKAWRDDRAFVEQRLDAALTLMRIAWLAEDTEAIELWIGHVSGLLDQGIKGSASQYIYPLRQIAFAAQAIEYYSRIGDDQQVLVHGNRGLMVYLHIHEDLVDSGDDHMAWTSRFEPFIAKYIAALYRSDRSEILPVLERFYADDIAALTPETNIAPVKSIKVLDAYLAAEEALVNAQTDWQNNETIANTNRLESARNKRDEQREFFLAKKSIDGQTSSSHKEPATKKTVNIAETDIILRYFISDEVSFVLAKTRDGEHFYELPEKTAIEEIVGESLDSLRSFASMTSDQHRVLNKLTVLLPIDLLQQGRFKKLVIIPDDVLHRVPFSVINLSENKAAFEAAGSSYEIVRTHSVLAYHASNSQETLQSPVDQQDIVIFADPVFSSNDGMQSEAETFRNWSNSLQRLPYTAREAEFIASLYPQGMVSSFLGTDATSSRLMSPEARYAHVLHIATHGYFNPATPDIVGIATSVIDSAGQQQRGFLSLTELLSRRFHSNLIIISGCETMLGRSYRGLGELGLTRGLMSRGAGSVIGTLWRVPDRATAEFMGKFYTNLRDNGGNASRALLKTRQQFIQSGQYSSLAYWAGFALTSSNALVEQNVFSK